MRKKKYAAAKLKTNDEYILTTKIYCGKYKTFMVGKSGINLQERKYHYYKYIDAKRNRGCDKKVVKNTKLLDLVKDKNYFVITTNIDHSFKELGLIKKDYFSLREIMDFCSTESFAVRNPLITKKFSSQCVNSKKT